MLGADLDIFNTRGEGRNSNIDGFASMLLLPLPFRGFLLTALASLMCAMKDSPGCQVSLTKKGSSRMKGNIL